MNLVCHKCGHKWNYKGSNYRADCYNCRKKGIYTKVKTGIPTPWQKGSSKVAVKGSSKRTVPVSSDFMSGSLVDALKKTGLDPMKNGQIRDAISSLLETDECKIAWANALEEKKTNSIKLAKKVLKSWLKKERYL